MLRAAPGGDRVAREWVFHGAIAEGSGTAFRGLGAVAPGRGQQARGRVGRQTAAAREREPGPDRAELLKVVWTNERGERDSIALLVPDLDGWLALLEPDADRPARQRTPRRGGRSGGRR